MVWKEKVIFFVINLCVQIVFRDGNIDIFTLIVSFIKSKLF